MAQALQLKQAVPVGKASQLRCVVLVDVVPELGLAGAREGAQHHELRDDRHLHHHRRVHPVYGLVRVRVHVPVYMMW